MQNIGTGPTGSPVLVTENLPTGFIYVSKDSVTINGANVTAATTVNNTDPNAPVFTVPGTINAGQSLILKFTAQVAASLEPGSYCNTFQITSPTTLGTGTLACVTVAGGKIGDTIYRDWDGDGVQDTGEEGIAGVTVKLYDSNNLLATTTTDANGNYYFPGLVAGTYVVEVNNGADLPGTIQTGDPDGTINNRHTVNLATDQQYLTADFGYQPTGAGSIGDTVFEDIANDALYNGADTDIPGVTVSLYEDANGDGVIDPATDAFVITATTSITGYYNFTGLATGVDYIAYVNPADSGLAAYFGAPFQASTPNPAAVDNLTGAYLAADFGFWKLAPSSIGDQVFIDNDGDRLYDPNVDTPLAGVTVVLQNSSGVTFTTVTGPDGTYLFSNLGPGDYAAEVDTATAPDNVGVVVSRHVVTLSAGQNYLDADFPFAPFLTKTSTPSFVQPGDTITYTLRPFYPGSELLTNVRIIDPIPFSTTYTAASANAGGSYGAYVPIAAAPGEELEGGPAGTTTLQSSVTVTPSFVTVGGSVTATVRITSEVNLTGVSPTDFVVDGGAATCTGPAPASANLTANTGQNFVWSCTLGETGEYIFSAGASDTAGDNVWPTASSASVLAAPTGGPNVVTWNLGSNNPGVPGETITSGYVSGIYAFRGGNTKEFSRYSISGNNWVARAQPTNGIEKGGSLTGDGAGTLYALEGNSKIFYEYNIATNTWTALANTSDNANEGGAVQYLDVGGTEYVFALLGGSNRFRRYSVSGNSWTNMVNTPSNVKKGGALTTDGTYIYALRGDGQESFWRCNATTNALLAPVPVPAVRGKFCPALPIA